ncbi:hypothetical protein RDI58_022227 [Solanum bulbocastanum]|uniref:Uncharacterized protein n=1 Tax=Solanum bulbocastanum TaxID=147425 RepID=A0AAN8Y7W3_SOLBU
MSLEQSCLIRVNSTGNLESTSKDLSNVQKSSDSILRIERFEMEKLGGIATELLGGRLQFRPFSEERNEVSTTGECSPGKVTGAPVNNEKIMLLRSTPCDDEELPKVTEPPTHQGTNVCLIFDLQDQVTIDDRNK